jgi:hypothetical protein
MNNPIFVAMAMLLLAVGLAVAGVYLIAGTGWALITASVPAAVPALVLLSGVARSDRNG